LNYSELQQFSTSTYSYRYQLNSAMGEGDYKVSDISSSIIFIITFLVSEVLAQTPINPLDLGIKTLTIASGPVGGAWYPLGAKLGEVIEKGLKIKVTVDIGGSAENVRRVNAVKDADIGLASTPEV
jgi:hypothetical protein